MARPGQQDLAELRARVRPTKGRAGAQQPVGRDAERELEERRARIVELQEEFAREQEKAQKVAESNAAELERSNQWRRG